MKHGHYLIVPATLVFFLNAEAQFGPAEILSENWCGTPFITRGADIDGDGDVDFCSASHADGLLRWLENGDGQGDVVAPHALGADVPGVTDLRLADMDSDGDLDRVTCSDVTNDIQWSANDGAGNFGAATTLATGLAGLNSMELVDLDQDGDLDVLATADVADSVVWVSNNGGGVFSSAQGLCGQLGGAHDVAVADFDEDGDLDLGLAALNETQPIWAENDGMQGFTIHLMPMSGPNGIGICEVADLNGDGHMDYVFSGPNTNFNWASGNGAGVFTYVGTVVIDGSLTSMNMKDMDGDGDVDALYTTPLFLDGTNLRYASNNGDGDFSLGVTLISNNQSFIRSDVADVDDDGLLDILLAAEYQQHVLWKRNEGGGEFENSWVVSPPAMEPNGLCHADLDADGDTDIIVGSKLDGKVIWLENDGSGGFSLPQHITHGLASLQEVCIGDIDDDGDTDVLTASQYDSTLAWYANDGLGDFGPRIFIDHTAGYNYSAALGDLDLDGDLDLVTTENNGGRMLVYANNGDGTFGTPVQSTAPANVIQDLIVGDVTGDGYPDVITATPATDRVTLFANDGAGALVNYQSISTAIDQVSRVLLSDLDGNGTMDIVCTANISGGVRWFANDGTGVFSAPQVAATPDIRAFDVVDMDSDGDIDIVGGEASTYAIKWFANDGSGTFTASTAATTPPPYPSLMMATDLDGDGDPDLVSGSPTSSEVMIYESFLGSPFRIQGRLFHDADNNAAYTAGEEPFPFIGVVSAPTWSSPYTTTTGEYTCYLAEGSYSVSSQAPDALWTLTTSPATHNVSLTTGAPVSTGNDFGYVPNGTVNDLIVSLSPLSPGCNGATHQWITWRNSGNTRPSGLVAYTIDPHYTFISAQPGPSSFAGSTLYWTYEDLTYYGEMTVHVVLGNPDESQIGEPIVNTLAVTIDEDGSPIAVFSDQSFRLVACAYDPNDKVVDPVGFGEQGVVDVDVSFLKYTVRFQNTGTSPASSVTIRDVLDPALDRTSVQLVGSSHTITDMRIETDGELVFTFDGINLPDSVSDEPGSHGFVTFRAAPLEGTPSGTTIENTADIYFDYNAPVITNTVSNLLIDCDLFSASITPLTNDLLQASAGESYQWYQDGIAIAGATSQELLVEATGIYSVEVTNAYGCVLLSEELQVVIEGVNEEGGVRMAVVPNPMSDVARVLFSEALLSSTRMELSSVNGSVLRTTSGNGSREVRIERGDLASGLYVLRMMRDGRYIGSVRVLVH